MEDSCSCTLSWNMQAPRAQREPKSKHILRISSSSLTTKYTEPHSRHNQNEDQRPSKEYHSRSGAEGQGFIIDDEVEREPLFTFHHNGRVNALDRLRKHVQIRPGCLFVTVIRISLPLPQRFVFGSGERIRQRPRKIEMPRLGRSMGF